jgi:diaminopimelate decarboxylase
MSDQSLRGFSIIDNQLIIGGKKIETLAAAIGSTPFYAYDRAMLTARVAQVRAALPDGWHLHYAMKANPMPAVVQHFSSMVDGIDVASAREMRVALDTGMPASNISIAGPGKRDSEIEQAVASGIIINIESEREIQAALECGRGIGVRPQISMRINPDFEVKGSVMRMGGGAKQFGIDASQAPDLLKRMRGLPLDFIGFHIYSGSQNLKAEALIETQTKTVDLARRLASHAPGPVRKLNIGGGFGIPYFPGENPLDLSVVGLHMRNLMSDIKRDFPLATPIIELGRYLVGEAGVYICRVLDRKISCGQVFLVTDGGLHHHLAASGNFGQFVRRNYPLVVANRLGAAEQEVVDVVGPLCTPLDLLGNRVSMARAEVGDLIAVFQSGAYGLTASPLQFLNHPLPLETIL